MDQNKNRFGKKHICFQCDTKFYDMNKSVPVCPRCGMDQTNKVAWVEPVVLTDKDIDVAVGRVFYDDQSLPGNLEMEVGGLNGDDSKLLEMEEDLGGALDDD